MSIRIEKPKAKGSWVPILVILLVAAGGFLWFRFAPRASRPLAFEVLGFEGDVQIYDLRTRSWRLPKRGEDFAMSQKLKTGADGMVNVQVENEIHLRLKENSEVRNEESRFIGGQEVYKLRLVQGVLLGATTRQFEQKQKAGQAALSILTRDYVANIKGAIFRVQASGQPGQESRVGVLRGFVEVSKPSLFRAAGIRIRGLEETRVVDGVIQPVTRVDPDSWSLMKESYELLQKTAAMEAEQIDLSKMAGNFFKVVFDHGTFFTPQMGFADREFYKDPESGEVILDASYDVFPAGSFAGVYIKTRDFDLSKYGGLAFDIRGTSDEPAPDSFFIEVKSKGNVVRRYAPKTFEKNWKPIEFGFHATKPLPVNEVVFVFTNTKVGEAKKGALEFRNVRLTPLPPAPAVPPAAPGIASTAVPAASAPAVVPPPAPLIPLTAPAPAAAAPAPKPAVAEMPAPQPFSESGN